MDLDKIKDVLKKLGFDERFNTEQTAVCVYILFKSQKGLKGLRIHDIIINAKNLLNKNYAENTRESIRKNSLKRLVNHGLLVLNPDNPKRPINSGLTNYSLELSFRDILEKDKNIELIKKWKEGNKDLLKNLKERIGKHDIYLKIDNKTIRLSYGKHNMLIKQITEVMIKDTFSEFEIFYMGDTKNKQVYINKNILKKLKFDIDVHDKLPDIMAYSHKPDKILVIESVTSVGAFENSRVQEIEELIKNKVKKKIKDVIYITAFLDMKTFSKFSKIVAFGTKVWVAEKPDRIINYS